MNPLNHVAIIMDGNGRWGLKYRNSRNAGHKEGLKTVEKIIKASIKYKIKFLTLYAFSTENWKRPKKEINFLFSLLENFLINKIKDLQKQNIKLKILGKKKFSKNINKLLLNAEKTTNKNKRLQINLALNYGAKSEIINTVKILNKKKLNINENNINKNLYTNTIPDPDILIRTGDTKRLSNFLLWQSAYTELYFTDKFWPDFDVNDLNEAVLDYQNRERKFGTIKS